MVLLTQFCRTFIRKTRIIKEGSWEKQADGIATRKLQMRIPGVLQI
jgi:hypothetical protein